MMDREETHIEDKQPTVRWRDESMALHWIDRYASGVDGEPQMGRILACVEPAAVRSSPAREQVTEAMVERMVQRFLQWKLPEDFNPDGGIQFVKTTDYGHTFEPVGTNLLDYRQAKAMVQHMLDGLLSLSNAAIPTGEVSVEALAEFLCGEFDFDLNPVVGAHWPEHPNDDGYRDGGYVKLQPADVQAHARDNAKRILIFLGQRPALSPSPTGGEAGAVATAFIDKEGNVSVVTGSELPKLLKALPDAPVGKPLLPLYTHPAPLMEEVEAVLERLCVAYAACNGEDHPAYGTARSLLIKLQGGGR